MVDLRPLRRDDVTMLDEHLRDDSAGTARLGMPPAQWWHLVNGDPNRSGWIVLDGDRPVGYLDAEHKDGTVYVAALICAADRAHGFGADVVRAALTMSEFEQAGDVVGCVEIDNAPARRLLRRAGFEEDGLDEDGLMLYRYSLDGLTGSRRGSPR